MVLVAAITASGFHSLSGSFSSLIFCCNSPLKLFRNSQKRRTSNGYISPADLTVKVQLYLFLPLGILLLLLYCFFVLHYYSILSS